jgi:methylthioribose-1-phosphate isomerase
MVFSMILNRYFKLQANMISKTIYTRPIWLDSDHQTLKIIDQRLLPHSVSVLDLKTADDVIMAIGDMAVRGAPLIGVTAAYGVYLSVVNSKTQDNPDKFLMQECRRIKISRPTAVNLIWAVDRMLERLSGIKSLSDRIEAARKEAESITEAEVDNCRRIGIHGLSLFQRIAAEKPGKPLQVLTHCNAGWLACVEHGTATAPIYAAFEAGMDIHVWVDETRPLNQGARLTAWELGQRGVRHTVITDNAGGHLMQHGMVDVVIVGSDRATRTGDIANKIGTYLKALAAKDNNVPFYVALPSSTFDWNLTDGMTDIPIEVRDPDEVRYVQGLAGNTLSRVLIPPAESPAANYAFDVTPARLVTGLITERGVCRPDASDILRLFPEHSKSHQK